MLNAVERCLTGITAEADFSVGHRMVKECESPLFGNVGSQSPNID